MDILSEFIGGGDVIADQTKETQQTGRSLPRDDSQHDVIRITEAKRKRGCEIDENCNAEDCRNAQPNKTPRSDHQNIKKPLACDICDQAFARSDHLMTHKRTHTGEKPFACDICDQKFVQSGQLTVHKRTHSGIKPFACDICDKKFAQQAHLLNHKRTHSGIKPYACDECDRRFTTSRNLTVHKRTHTGEKPFACDICNQKFGQLCNLVTHKRTHTGEKPFACDICDQKFAHGSHLVRHKRNNHTKEGQARQKKQEQRVCTALEAAGYVQAGQLGEYLPPPMHFVREHRIDFTCVGDIDGSYCRIDFVITLANGAVVMLEVDEDQHRFGYGGIGCDMKRMTKMIESIAIGNPEFNQPIRILRYNPSACRIEGNLLKKRKRDREAWLVEHLKTIGSTPMHSIGGGGVMIQYAYYDQSDRTDGLPDICHDAEYNATLREVVSVVGID